MCVRACACACVRACVRACACVRARACVRVRTCVRACACTCLRACVCLGGVGGHLCYTGSTCVRQRSPPAAEAGDVAERVPARPRCSMTRIPFSGTGCGPRSLPTSLASTAQDLLCTAAVHRGRGHSGVCVCVCVCVCV